MTGPNLNSGIFYFCEGCRANTLHTIDYLETETETATAFGDRKYEPFARRCLTCTREEMFQTLQERVEMTRYKELTRRYGQRQSRL